jgi:flagellar basal body-associated protein FliL
MAWAKGGWSSFEQFQKRQKTMMWIIITLLVVITVTQIVGALYVRENVGGLTISN